jgi:hypothetical protein
MEINLYSKSGLSSRPIICKECGAYLGVTLVAAQSNVFLCKKCGLSHVGSKPDFCLCGTTNPEGFVKKGKVRDYEKLPCGVCEDCKEGTLSAKAS